MIVPEFWVEATGEAVVKTRRITVKRLGWSDSSAEEAHQKAQERLLDAIRAIEAGEVCKRVDLRTAYNGADGLPIREEIISRHQDVVVTRNGYGARCLNTPDVLFADVDFVRHLYHGPTLLSVVIFLLATACVGVVTGSWWSTLSFIALYFLLAGFFYKKDKNKKMAEQINEKFSAQERIRRFVEENPAWHLRVYRTPLGLRVLVMHQCFDPRDDSVKDFFAALQVDPLYQTMCFNQRCFRARVSAKPWRIGIAEHIPPQRSLWPVSAEVMAARSAWVKTYEDRAEGYAACRFIESLGSNRADSKALQVQVLHDELCRANLDVPLA